MNFADEFCSEVCRSSAKAPRGPIAGTTTVSMSDEKLRADLFLPDDLMAVRATDGFPPYSLVDPSVI